MNKFWTTSKYAKETVKLLKNNHLILSTAESFTGGGVANTFIYIDGVSSVFFEGIVAYHPFAKEKRLFVNHALLEEKGAIDKEVARQMLEGLLQTQRCNIAVATTGIAGAGTDKFNTPIGKAFIAVGSRTTSVIKSLYFKGNRKKIMQQAVRSTIKILYQFLYDNLGEERK